ncbi:DNA polymerase III subunit delta [Alicyclobacillus acidiphilus]|uniref:DNA polymerase III subunit delta n=1 Tax=Alicyclobacillus acidiphilus TaxID=182455 RepID=UPI000831A49B|nr:DNA polymerase III subunit delta [Alicyclobacillus acidiphilus]
MDFFQAYEQISAASLASVYVLYGTETGLMDMFVNRLVEQSPAQRVSRYDYEEDGVEQALLDLDTFSLFAEPTIVLIRNCTAFLSQGKTSGQGDELLAYLSNPAPGRTLVLTAAADKLDERKKITKEAKRHMLIQCQTPKGNIARNYLAREAKRQQIAIDDAAVETLWRKCQTITQCLSELKKLSVYALARTISAADVEKLVPQTIEETVFDWVDHVVQGHVAAAINSLQSLARQGYDALALIAMLVRQIRMMCLAKELSARRVSPEEMAKIGKVHPFAMKVAIRQSGAFSERGLERLLLLAADCEYDIKRGRRDGIHALELLILTASKEAARKEYAG